MLPIPIVVPAALILGWVCGIVVNLLADYLPARRYHFQARTNPFGSASAVPPAPHFVPFRADGRPWPFYQWSSLIAWMSGQPVFDDNRRLRHVLIEALMALVFGAIAWQFSENLNLAFLLFYAPCLTLIVVIDIEHRWVFLETIVPPALVALAEATFWPRVLQYDAIKGGLYGFACMMAIYLFGFLFGHIMGLIRKRAVGRTVFGIGDVYIGTLTGLLVGWSSFGFALMIMVTSGALAAFVLIAIRVLHTRRYKFFSAIPYGPHIVLGTAVMLYMPQVVDVLIRRLLNWPY